MSPSQICPQSPGTWLEKRKWGRCTQTIFTFNHSQHKQQWLRERAWVDQPELRTNWTQTPLERHETVPATGSAEKCFILLSWLFGENRFFFNAPSNECLTNRIKRACRLKKRNKRDHPKCIHMWLKWWPDVTDQLWVGGNKGAQDWQDKQAHSS